MNSGGTTGGGDRFLLGLLLSSVSFYFFIDSVMVQAAGTGWVSGALRGGRGQGLWQTTSMGIIFLPFFVGVVALFYNAKKQWAWVLTWIGLGIIAVEILSRLQFLFNIKASHLIIMLTTFAAGVGLMLRSYRDESKVPKPIRKEKS